MTAALDVLQRTFGYPAFRGQQAEIVDHVISGGDALVLMPTGGGKSLCYQVPSMVRPGTGVVISPLIALMQDQVEALRTLGIRAGFLNSTQDAGARRSIEQQFLARRVGPAVSRSRAVEGRLAHRAAGARHHRPVRHRRSPLRVPVGPRLPP
ncbi:MAG: DEAD/DEAH box helicase [Ilumatobacteraceae bacterium]